MRAPETAGVSLGSGAVAAMARLDGRAIRGGTVARSSHDRCAARDDGPSPSPPPSRPELCSKSSRSATLGDARYADKTSSLPFPTRLGRSGLNRLRERWLALCLIAQLVRKNDWLTRRTRDVVRSAGVPWGRTAGHWRRFPHGRPLGSRTLPPVRSRMSMTISRRCSASSGPLSAVMPLRRSHRATVARGTNPQAESGRGVALDSGRSAGSGGVWDADEIRTSDRCLASYFVGRPLIDRQQRKMAQRAPSASPFCHQGRRRSPRRRPDRG